MRSFKGYLMILLSAIGYGSYGVWSRFLGPEFSPFFQGWVRSALVLLGLIPFAFLTKSFTPVKKEDIKWLLVPVIAGAFCSPTFYYAYVHIDIGTATFIIYAFYLITLYLVGKIFFSEHITIYKIISFVLACIGLYFIFGFSLGQFSLLAIAAAVIDGVASAVEVSTTKKSAHKFNSLEIAIYIWAGGFISNLALSLLFGEKQLVPSLSPQWISMYIFSGVGLITFWLVVEGFKHVDAAIGGLIGLFEIVVSVFLGILLFNQHLNSSILFGGGLILFSAMLPDLVDIASKSRNQTPTKTDTPVVVE